MRLVTAVEKNLANDVALHLVPSDVADIFVFVGKIVFIDCQKRLNSNGFHLRVHDNNYALTLGEHYYRKFSVSYITSNRARSWTFGLFSVICLVYPCVV